MLRLLTCASGHFWESVDAVPCPKCGAPPESLPLLALEGDELPPAAALDQPDEAASDSPCVAGYEEPEALGKGPTGLRLYKAKQKVTGRVVLLEVVLAREDSSQHAWSSLRSQAAALARLAHPGIVGLLEVGERDRQLFYNVCEWVEGPTLAQLAAAKRLPAAQAVRLVETLARIIDHAHGKGVLHRNLRPGAVLLQPTSLSKDLPDRANPPGPACWLNSSACLPRIAGFGLVRRPVVGEAADLELYGEEAGFLSPEQAWGRAKEFGPATDVWALGAILYFLLTGKPPYEGKKPADVLEAIQGGDPPRARGVGADMQAILGKALARGPSRRYSTAGELADDLRRLALHLPLACRPPTAGYRFGKWMRRNPASAAILFLAGLAIAGTVGGYICGAVGTDAARRAASRAGTDQRTAEARLKAADAELVQLRGRLRLDAYRRLIDQAAGGIAREEKGAARAALDRADMADRGFEWTLLRQQATGGGKSVLPPYAGNIYAATLDPTGRLAAVASRGDRLGQGDDGKLVVWHVPTKAETLSRNGPFVIRAIAFSPSGDAVAAAGSDDQERGVLKAWSLAEGARRGDTLFEERLAARPLTGLAYSPDGKAVAAASEASEAFLLSAAGVRLSHGFGPKAFRFRTAHLAWSADSEQIAMATATTRELRLWVDGLRRPLRTVDTAASASALASSAGKEPLFAVACTDRFVRCYADTGEARGSAGPLDAVPERVAFSPDGKRLAVALDNGKVLLLATAGGAWDVLLTIPVDGTRGLSFSADGQLLLASGTKEVVILGRIGN